MPIVIYEVHHGFGKHRQFIADQDYMNFTRLSYVEWVQTFQTLMFNKLSVCFFLLRLPASNPYKRPIIGAIVGLIVSNVILTIIWVFQCWPVPKVWHPSIHGQCMTNAQLERIIISQALVSIISDFFLALFPVVLLWKVQMALRAKVGVCALMGLGLITAGLCIARAILNWENVNADPTWESIPNWGFRSWEISVGIIAACIPALRPGYRALSGQLSSFVSQHYGSATSRLNSRIRTASHSNHHHRSGVISSRRKAPCGGDSDDSLVGDGTKGARAVTELEDMADLAEELTRPGAVVAKEAGGGRAPPVRGGVHTASVHADPHMVEAGDDEGSLAREGARGDLGNGGERGIVKTVWFGTDVDTDTSPERSLGAGDLESGTGGRGFPSKIRDMIGK
ncbi:MAG: hypothetical protein Q9165_002936 [Trypethelium subeluteriae]